MKYTFVFRCCDILPAFERQDNSWTRYPKNAAINEVLCISADFGVVWKNVEGMEAVSCDGASLFTITASTENNEDQDYIIRQRYNTHRDLSGMVDELDATKCASGDATEGQCETVEGAEGKQSEPVEEVEVPKKKRKKKEEVEDAAVIE